MPRPRYYLACSTDAALQNLREEVAMNVDADDEEETQRPRTVADYGIEVDFENLDDEDRDVRNVKPYLCAFTDTPPRTHLQKLLRRLRTRLPSYLQR